MNIAEFRLDLLRVLQDHEGAHFTEDVARLVEAERRGIPLEEVKHALDGLADADLIVWEARGDHAWRISAIGRDYLASVYPT